MGKSKQTQTIQLAAIEALIKRAESGLLSAADAPLVINLARLILQLLSVIDDKKISIARLKRMLFGPKSEKRRNASQQTQSESNNQPNGDSSQNREAVEQSLSTPIQNNVTTPDKVAAEVEKKKKPGHGCLGAKDFPGATVVICLHKELQPDNKCPHPHCGGNLRDTNEPAIFIQRQSRPIIDAIKFERQVLRCSRCRDRFTAQLPDNVTAEKFDKSADVMIALLHYGCAMPFYRLEQMQLNMGVPLPASTQFERAEVVANSVHPVFLELKRVAAKSGLLHTDDTTARILSLIKENKALSEDERKGIYTTAIGARSPEFDIVLYSSGRRYSSENLDLLMEMRPDDLTEFILMADAENKNWSKNFSYVIAKCLAHARRKFVDCEPAFRTECSIVLDKLGEVYKIDAQTKNMNPQERLEYHQQKSLPIMDDLKQYMDNLINIEKKEPNSALGKAIKYMHNHWLHLTRFLQIPGCPIDNNFIERCLRKAVILRKNSLFFKTTHGAEIFDVLASIISTCNLNNINSFDYLLTLMNNKTEVRLHPELWLPWNYQKQKKKVA